LPIRDAAPIRTIVNQSKSHKMKFSNKNLCPLGLWPNRICQLSKGIGRSSPIGNAPAPLRRTLFGCRRRPCGWTRTDAAHARPRCSSSDDPAPSGKSRVDQRVAEGGRPVVIASCRPRSPLRPSRNRLSVSGMNTRQLRLHGLVDRDPLRRRDIFAPQGPSGLAGPFRFTGTGEGPDGAPRGLAPRRRGARTRQYR
jgi:hypothetical protein